MTMNAPLRPDDQTWRRNLLVVGLGSFTTIVGMTLILPILPLHVRALGVTGPSDVALWSGIAYAATFLTAALTAPLWGRLGDRYGRKPMLIRASLGMAVAMSLIGLAQDVTQLVLLRLLAGLLGGYASGATILVAAQTPKERSAWALGVLSSAIMTGNIAGPLIGGTIGAAFGVQIAFLATGGLIFLGFLGTLIFLREEGRPRNAVRRTAPAAGGWSTVPDKPAVVALLGLSALLVFSTVSVEPIITVHVQSLGAAEGALPVLAAIAFSLTAAGTIVSGPWLGRLADRIGHVRVLSVSLAAATVLLALQAAVPEFWAFAALRLLTGIALGGITPTVVATIRRLLPDTTVGLVLGYNVSAQYVGQVTGPILAGWLAGIAGTDAVFIATAAITAAGTLAAVVMAARLRPTTAAKIETEHQTVPPE